MNDLNPDARRLVDLAREARTPGRGDKRRVAERLAVPLAASAAVVTGAAASKAAAGATLLGGLGTKIAAVVAVGALGTALFVSRLDSEQGAAVAPIRHVATEPAPPPAPAIPAPAAKVETDPAPPEPKKLVKPSDDLVQEAALLHEAQSAWRAGQSARALQLANQHAQRFPRSQLANERDVLRVLSLCKLGQAQAAKQVGARLLRQTKGSPWYQSVAGSCAAE